MSSQLSEAFEHIDNATSELSVAATGNPDVAKLLARLCRSTAQFVQSRERCKEGAKFLSDNRKIWRWTQQLCPDADEATLINLCNCILCARESLKTSVCRSFCPEDIASYAQTPIAVYQDFQSKFNERVSARCRDEAVAKSIQQYVTAAITQLLSQFPSVNA